MYHCIYIYICIRCTIYAATAAKSLQSCPTLCDPINSSPQGSAIPGILQARTLEWVAISFSNAWKWKVKVKLLSHVWLLVTPWTAAYQAPLPMGFSKQEYWMGCHCLLRVPYIPWYISIIHIHDIYPLYTKIFHNIYYMYNNVYTIYTYHKIYYWDIYI